MRKLKLQVQITVDGFIAGPNGEMDWEAISSPTVEQRQCLFLVKATPFDCGIVVLQYTKDPNETK